MRLLTCTVRPRALAACRGLAPWQGRLRMVFRESFAAWFDHRAGSKSAALAFYTLFSMTPILLLAIAVAGYVFGADAAQGAIVGQVQGLVGPNGAQAIQALLAAARDPASGLLATLIAGVLLLVGATSVFVELKNSLDEVWEIERSAQSSFGEFVKTRLLSFGLVLVLAFLLLVSLVVSAALAMLEPLLQGFVGGMPSSSVLLLATLSMLSTIVSFAVIASMFAIIYKTLPEAALSWRDVWIGAVFTAALFNLGKYAIGLYLGNSGVASGFGAAGSLIAVLLWVYYSAQIFFLGAEFTRQYALRFGSLQQERQRVARILSNRKAH
ncbi:MAG: YihY/virulence factor BrkB family protein [Proteobacteria bacterium]|nr:YihY/virulence factor BrkB family protein [Pseudomonadota bacterium]